MQRYNMFNQVHKGLRAKLYDTALSLQHTCFANTDEANETLEKLEEAVQMFHSHAEHEDHYVLPVVQEHAPVLAREFESEHEKDESLSTSILNLVTAYRLSADNETRRSTGYAITIAFNEFIAFNLYHMNKEEDKINRILWDNYTNTELTGITKAIIANIPPSQLGLGNKWMMRGMNNDEIITWLSAVKNSAPDIAFRSLFTLAETELPPSRWNEVKEGLMEGAMMA